MINLYLEREERGHRDRERRLRKRERVCERERGKREQRKENNVEV